jgi:hypothetical protein
VTVLHEPPDSTLAPPASAPDTLPAPRTPADLLPLARRARRDAGSAREFAVALLARGWAATSAAAVSGLAVSAVTALSRVRRPGTAAASVADDVAARARRRTARLT